MPSAAPAAPLRARRCSRHAEREALARCPSCRAFFCRECVVEHEGKLVCASCLARLAAGPGANAPAARRGRLARAATLAASVLVLGGVFFAVGQVLLRIPPELHEGTLWERAVKGQVEPAE